MLELLSPYFPTFPKDTGGYMDILRENTNDVIQAALHRPPWSWTQFPYSTRSGLLLNICFFQFGDAVEC